MVKCPPPPPGCFVQGLLRWSLGWGFNLRLLCSNSGHSKIVQIKVVRLVIMIIMVIIVIVVLVGKRTMWYY